MRCGREEGEEEEEEIEPHDTTMWGEESTAKVDTRREEGGEETQGVEGKVLDTAVLVEAVYKISEANHVSKVIRSKDNRRRLDHLIASGFLLEA